MSCRIVLDETKVDVTVTQLITQIKDRLGVLIRALAGNKLIECRPERPDISLWSKLCLLLPYAFDSFWEEFGRKIEVGA